MTKPIDRPHKPKGGAREGAGRPPGSKNKVTKGKVLRETLAELGHDIDARLAEAIVHNIDDIEMVKTVMPYLYSKVPQEQEITTSEGIPILTLGVIKQEDD